jgi:hypothetical protein
VRPARLTDAGFADASTHRSQLSAVYNAYSWLDDAAAQTPGLEDHLLVLRPLFWLSFMVDDYLAEQSLLGHGPIAITSASSKAAIGIAYLLSRRGVAVLGMTAATNVEFVEQLGVYDQVHAYDEIDPLIPAPAVVVDVAGNPAQRAQIARRSANAVARHVAVGATHHDAAGLAAEPSSEQATFFFAPQQIRARARQWGWDDLNARYTAALHSFAADASGWLQIVAADGRAAVERAYMRILNNEAHPTEANVLTLAVDTQTPVVAVRERRHVS